MIFWTLFRPMDPGLHFGQKDPGGTWFNQIRLAQHSVHADGRMNEDAPEASVGDGE